MVITMEIKVSQILINKKTFNTFRTNYEYIKSYKIPNIRIIKLYMRLMEYIVF
jgi:hypothetical protein